MAETKDRSNEEDRIRKSKKKKEKKKMKRDIDAEDDDNTRTTEPKKRKLESTPEAEEEASPPSASECAATGESEKSSEPKPDLEALDAVYQKALAAYKADKTNKDLRRAKTAAKRAWEAAVIASAEPGEEAIVCRNCSQLFMFGLHEKFQERGWETPVQCKGCAKSIDIKRSKDRRRVDQKQNMCYEFQKTGTCSRGDRCKFSHQKRHVGKKKQAGLLVKACRFFSKGEPCPHGEKCRFRHEQ